MLVPRIGDVTLRPITKECFSRISSIKVRGRLSSTAVPREKSNETHTTATTKEDVLSKFPLSAIPTGMLLRSLFIATISSNRLLLLPSLRLLAFFAKENRSFLFNVDRNPILHAILKKMLYNQFCAGETLRETNACVRQLKDLGFRGVILTYAKELVYDQNTDTNFCAEEGSQVLAHGEAKVVVNAEIESWKVGTLQTIDLIDEGDILAIKYVEGLSIKT